MFLAINTDLTFRKALSILTLFLRQCWRVYIPTSHIGIFYFTKPSYTLALFLNYFHGLCIQFLLTFSKTTTIPYFESFHTKVSWFHLNYQDKFCLDLFVFQTYYSDFPIESLKMRNSTFLSHFFNNLIGLAIFWVF